MAWVSSALIQLQLQLQLQQQLQLEALPLPVRCVCPPAGGLAAAYSNFTVNHLRQ